jgi:hypothetical protein
LDALYVAQKVVEHGASEKIKLECRISNFIAASKHLPLRAVHNFTITQCANILIQIAALQQFSLCGLMATISKKYDFFRPQLLKVSFICALHEH